MRVIRCVTQRSRRSNAACTGLGAVLGARLDSQSSGDLPTLTRTSSVSTGGSNDLGQGQAAGAGLPKSLVPSTDNQPNVWHGAVQCRASRLRKRASNEWDRTCSAASAVPARSQFLRAPHSCGQGSTMKQNAELDERAKSEANGTATGPVQHRAPIGVLPGKVRVWGVNCELRRFFRVLLVAAVALGAALSLLWGDLLTATDNFHVVRLPTKRAAFESPDGRHSDVRPKEPPTPDKAVLFYLVDTTNFTTRPFAEQYLSKRIVVLDELQTHNLHHGKHSFAPYLHKGLAVHPRRTHDMTKAALFFIVFPYEVTMAGRITEEEQFEDPHLTESATLSMWKTLAGHPMVDELARRRRAGNRRAGVVFVRDGFRDSQKWLPMVQRKSIVSGNLGVALDRRASGASSVPSNVMLLTQDIVWTTPPTSKQLIMLPYLVNQCIGTGMDSPVKTNESLALDEEELQHPVISFLGTVDRYRVGGTVRRRFVQLLEAWKTASSADPARLPVFGDSGHTDGRKSDNFECRYAALLKASKFCAVLRGDSCTSRRLFEAVLESCIPLTISDGVVHSLPFASFLNYSKVSLWMKERDLLGSTVEDGLQDLQRLMAEDDHLLEERKRYLRDVASPALQIFPKGFRFKPSYSAEEVSQWLDPASLPVDTSPRMIDQVLDEASRVLLRPLGEPLLRVFSHDTVDEPLFWRNWRLMPRDRAEQDSMGFLRPGPSLFLNYASIHNGADRLVLDLAESMLRRKPSELPGGDGLTAPRIGFWAAKFNVLFKNNVEGPSWWTDMRIQWGQHVGPEGVRWRTSKPLGSKGRGEQGLEEGCLKDRLSSNDPALIYRMYPFFAAFESQALFCIVQNPFARLGSEYQQSAFRAKGFGDVNAWINETLAHVARVGGIRDIEFMNVIVKLNKELHGIDVLAKRGLASPITEHCQVYTTQVAYAATCHHVLKLEDLAKDYSLFEVLLRAYGVDITSLPVLDFATVARDGESFARDLNEASRALVREYYVDDFDVLGYSMY